MNPKKWKNVKTKLFIFFILGILGISTSFLLLSCGTGPMFKVRNVEKGACAVDFSKEPPDTSPDATNEYGFILLQQSIKNMENSEFTIEAWLKKKTAGNLRGAIFTRSDIDAGIFLYVVDNEPSFKMKRDKILYKVDSGNTSWNNGVWKHIAAMLVNENHSSGPNAHGSCNEDIGKYTSIDVDSNDYVHISYVGVSGEDSLATEIGALKYATNSSGSWVIEAIDNSIDSTSTRATIVEGTSINLDSSDTVHVIYRDSGADISHRDLDYATGTLGSWTVTQQLQGGGTPDTGTYPSSVIDSSDNLYATYYDPAGSKISLHKKKPDGTWPWWPKQVDNINTAYTSIDKDAVTVGVVHISYYDVSGGNLKYANVDTSPANPTSGNPTTWTVTTTTLDSSADVGKYSSIAVDSANNIHISYYDDTANKLKYATNKDVVSGFGTCNADTDWDCTDIDSSANVGQYSSITVDSSDNLYISYYDASSGNLKLATNKDVGAGTCNANTDWNCLSIDSNTNVGQYTSIAADKNTAPEYMHISYYDVANTHLKYAVCDVSTNCDNDSEWTLATIPGSETEEPHLDIFIDGVFQNCASTARNFTSALEIRATEDRDPYAEQIALVATPYGTGLTQAQQLFAAVDEVRVWKVARTPSEIQQCMDQELGLEGVCKIDNSKLKGYWKFNACSGITVSDHAGTGNSGTVSYCDEDCTEVDAHYLNWDGDWLDISGDHW